jgi:hypothetical protein
MDIQSIARKIAESKKLPKAEKYNLSYREFDDMVELIGLIPDPNYTPLNEKDNYVPKCWVTLDVFSAQKSVEAYL